MDPFTARSHSRSRSCSLNGLHNPISGGSNVHLHARSTDDLQKPILDLAKKQKTMPLPVHINRDSPRDYRTPLM